MLSKVQIKRIVKATLLIGFAVVSIAFVEKKRGEKTCENIEVKIEGEEENYFLTKAEIIDMASARNQDSIYGGKLIHINQRAIENRLKNNKFVRSVEVVEDHRGSLTIYVKQNRPIARVFKNGKSFYVDKKGGVLPLSNVYTARVPLVFCNNRFFSESSDSLVLVNEKAFVEMLKMIDSDKFLKAQIAEITVRRNDEIMLHTQISGQPVEFGKCEQLVDKFESFRIVYENILPRKGWGTYEEISLKYKDQIICK
jgi:cell division protein FtsQ